MRRAHVVLAATVLITGCTSDVVSGHGTGPTGAPPSGTQAPSSGAPTSGGSGGGTGDAVVFHVTGHAGGVTAVLKQGGTTKSLGAITLPYTLRVPGAANGTSLVVTITGGGTVECLVRDASGAVLSDSGGGSTDTGTFACGAGS